MTSEYILDQPSLSPDEMLERMQMLRYKVHEKKIENTWTELLNAGFDPLLIKGWAAAQFYPQPYKREFSDIDIVIEPRRYEEVEKFLKANPNGYNIDLHRGLRRHDTLPFEEIFSSAKFATCGSVEIRMPRPEDHLRILCVHWLTDGGAYRAKLWDIYYAISNRADDFDWDRLLNVVSPIRRRWIVCTIGLAHKYLGLKIEDTPLAEEALIIPPWIIKTVEREWESETRLQPLAGIQYNNGRNKFLAQLKNFILLNVKNDPKGFWVQLQKRLFPNPIYATVDLEGKFDRKPRVFYQLGSFLRRLKKFGLMKDE